MGKSSGHLDCRNFKLLSGLKLPKRAFFVQTFFGLLGRTSVRQVRRCALDDFLEGWWWRMAWGTCFGGFFSLKT